MVSGMRNVICAFIFLALVSCTNSSNKAVPDSVAGEPAPQLRYGLEIQKYDVEPGQVKKGDFFGSIMEDFGVGANQVQKILKASEGVFDAKKIKLGSSYERISEVLQKSEWILDGNYISTMEMRMQKSDTVFFLDFPLDVCLAGIAERRGKPRSDMPWVETEDNTEFLEYVKNFNSNYRSQIMELLDRYCSKNIYRFSDRTEANEFIKWYQEK